MSKPSIDQTIEGLNHLRTTVRDFATREEKLTQDLRLKIAAEQRRRDKAIEELNNRSNTEIEEAELRYCQLKQAAESRYAGRKARITRAHVSSKKRALDKIDYTEGCRKHKLQTEMIKATKAHKSGLETTEKNCEQFKESLAAENVVIMRLEEKGRRAFSGYGKFRRLLSPGDPGSVAGDENQLILHLRELRDQARDQLKEFNRLPLPFLFRFRFFWITLAILQVPLVPVLQHFAIDSFTYRDAILSVAGCFVAGFILHYLGGRQAAVRATKLAATLVEARQTHDACLQKSDRRFKEETERIENEFQGRSKAIDDEWNQMLAEAAEARETFPREVDDRAARVSTRHEQNHRRTVDRINRQQTEMIDRLKEAVESKRQELAGGCATREAQLNAAFQIEWQKLEADWNDKIPPLRHAIDAAQAAAAETFPPWSADACERWKPVSQFQQSAKVGSLVIDLPKCCEMVPKDSRLAFPGGNQFSVPLSLAYPRQGSILFESAESGRADAIGALNNTILRLLATTPPGKLSFTIVDPVGLGQNFAGVMHLADYADYLVNGRIWTQSSQIEEKLADLNEHMEKVIQMYLRNEYETIAEYNEQAGNIAEKYHFLVIADFPTNFTDTALKRLVSIATSGARCGVYTLIHWDQRQTMAHDFASEELRKSSVCIHCKGKKPALAGKGLPGAELILDPPPNSDLAIDFVHKVGKASRDSNRVEVPFAHVAPAEGDIWSVDTTTELRVPIGRTGATKLQYFSVGKGTRQHGLVAGKTGSGKSTLFHAIITNLALWCSPAQVEFYLIDFKKGVEFKCYASKGLPHARVVAIESDRQFGLSVLQRIDDELKRRGELFRELGAQDLAGYRKAGGKEILPRTLLIIDEFQEFFVEEDNIAQSASVLLDRIVRQGRAFGIHVLLGSQTLGGAYTMARTTMGQMVVRIALQCNEADAYLIMDDSNPAPRLLSRPGEGIYNDAAGAKEGNSPFQAVWLSDDDRDGYLDRIQEKARQSAVPFAAPIVFEGDAPADIRENVLLERVLRAELLTTPSAPRIWLGAPNSIKGPTEAVFQRQGGNNLLLVGQRDDAILAIFASALISLSAQFPTGAARFILFDGSPAGSAPREFLEKIVRAIPHAVTIVKNSDLAETMNELTAAMKGRVEGEDATNGPATFLFIHGIQKFSKLRYEEDFSFSSDAGSAANPATQMSNLICGGASVGFHVIASVDTYNNVNRFLSKKALGEFEMRVLFQMSANDSASLIDSTKAGNLGLHRALLYNEQEGHIELFRPYALPGNEWIEQAGRDLSRLHAGGA